MSISLAMNPCLAVLLLMTFHWSRTVGTAAESLPPRSPFVESSFPFFSSVLDARDLGEGWPGRNLTPRGLILNLGNDCWACFDIDLLRISACWVGESVTPISMSQGSYHAPGVKVPEGQASLPKMRGAPWLANGLYPGWQLGDRVTSVDPREPGPDPNEVGRGALPLRLGRFRSIQLSQSGASLEYEVAGSVIREWMEARVRNGEPQMRRRFRLRDVTVPLWVVLGKGPANSDGTPRLRWSLQDHNPAGNGSKLLLEDTPIGAAVRIAPRAGAIEFSVVMSLDNLPPAWEALPSGASEQPPRSPLRWPEIVVTRGSLAKDTDSYVLDSITLPLQNPWGRHVRLADIAFFKDGRAAVVTFDGDVWQISGLSDSLDEVRWKRFASGLHEPLSLGIRDETIFVFDRNGIWRLRDIDLNGEADAHELVSNAFTQTAETREYANGMKLAPDGSFIIAKGGQTGTSLGTHNGSVLRVSPDGATIQVAGYGLRQPFIGVHPVTGLITASDQQGHYIPTTPLHIIQRGRYYGFLSLLLPKARYPSTIEDALTWIPHAINPSGAGQVWLVGAKMGPLNDALIHLGYYRPEVFLVRTHERGGVAQAAVVSVTRQLEFAPLNGAVGTSDGRLYIAGFQIWGTAANQISGLARLRHTGKASTLPREIVAMDEGMLVRFDVALDGPAATNPDNYSAERWNYARTPSYGSPHFKLDGSKGQEAHFPTSAYLSKDRKSVFIGFRDMRPVMQMRLGWTLATQTGGRFEQNAYFTPRELPRFNPQAEGFDDITVSLAPRLMRAEVRSTPLTVDEGKRLAELMGCAACHSTDGVALEKVGPSWKGLFGSERTLASGLRIQADEAYLRESIREPTAKVVAGFDKSDTGMPSYEGVLSDSQIEALVLYLKTIR